MYTPLDWCVQGVHTPYALQSMGNFSTRLVAANVGVNQEKHGMTDTENDNDEYWVQCSECNAGVLRRRSLTYYTWLDEELITVPNFPAWVCDMCGRREYDPRAISWLNTLLNPVAGRRRSARRKSGPTHLDLPPA